MKPKVKDIPQIYNIDIVRIYQENRLCGEAWIGSSLPMYLEEKFPEYLEATVNEMSISVEGVLSENVVLEIYLK
jgi:hypothetical protein